MATEDVYEISYCAKASQGLFPAKIRENMESLNPDKFKIRKFGVSDVIAITAAGNDYIADHQMNMFEDFIGYQGSAVLDEPVREEDSFSKESMSQESEISENILLPDLAKQSESIEQQSGEIAERGMPT